MENRGKILAWLDESGVEYELLEHEAAYTMDDMRAYGMTEKGDVCKNLFLRDHKGKRHFLIVVDGDKPVDLKGIGASVGQRLSFASAERLEKYLKLKQGEVSPLAVLFDEGKTVRVMFDKDLKGKTNIGVHPGDNRATVFLRFDALEKLVKSTGHAVEYIKV